MKATGRALPILGGLGLAVVLPFVALVPLVRHLWMAVRPDHAGAAAGTPALILLAIVGLAVAIPPVLLLRSIIRGAFALRGVPGRLRPLREREIAGVRFRVVPGDAVVLFVAGLLQPRIYVTEGALASLPADALRAGLLHEQAHQVRGDVAARFSLHAVGSALGWLPGVRSLVAGLTLRSEATADRLALQAGATRRGLFEAIVAASGAAAGTPAAGGTAVETRLRLIAGPGDVEPGAELPLVLLLGLIVAAPAAVSGLLTLIASYCGPI